VTKQGDGYWGHESEADLAAADGGADVQYMRLTIAGIGSIRGARGFAETALDSVRGEADRSVLTVTSSGVPGIPPYRVTTRIYDSGGGAWLLEAKVGGWTGSFPMDLSTANGDAFKGGAFNTAAVTPVVYIGKPSGAPSSDMELFVSNDAVVPTIQGASAPDVWHVQVMFSKAMDPASAQTASNFRLGGGLTVSAVSLSFDRRTATLTTSAMAKGASYTLTVSNVKDAITPPNTIAANSTVKFTVPPATPPTITGVSAPDMTHVQVVYSTPVDLATSTTLSNYAIGGATVTDA
jgi:hypothetical protein